MPLPGSRGPLPPVKRLLLAALAALSLLHAGVAHAQSDEVIDILVVYTSAAKEAAGGEANIEAQIDLMVAETNTAFRDSGANLRLRLVHVEELDYVETPDTPDFIRLVSPGDGHLDEVQALRAASGADLVHLIERWGAHGRLIYCGFASVGGAYATTMLNPAQFACGSRIFAHEVGHNLGLWHDRYTHWDDLQRLTGLPYAFGYVNQAMFEHGAPASSRWHTLMAYSTQCTGRFQCSTVMRFSNPDQTLRGDPLGVPGDQPSLEVVGPADARRALNANAKRFAARRTPPTTPAVLSLKRRQPVVETTNADTLRWRLAFNMDVKNVTGGDFELAGAGLAAPTLTVTPRAGGQRIHDIAATGGGLGSLNAMVTPGFASGHDIAALDDTALTATWPAAAQRSYRLDNTAPRPTIAPSTAGRTPFTATIRFDTDVTGFDDAGDVTATNATVTAPSRSDARTYTVQVTPVAGAATLTLTVPASVARDGAGNGNATAAGTITYAPARAATFTVSGLADTDVAENAAWTSAAPAVTGNPVGTVTWTKEGADAVHFAVDAATGVLRMAAQEHGNPVDADGNNAYEVTVRATDEDDNTATRALTITVVVASPPLPPPPPPLPPPPPPPSSGATLSALALSAGAFTFAPQTTAYAVAVPHAVASVTVTLAASDAGATVTVNGDEVASGEASAAIALAVGETLIEVEVTAPGATTRTYAVTVTRGPAEVALLPAASGALHGLVRVVNESDEAGTVTVRAFDDAGEEHGPVTLYIDAGAAVHFNSNDLESGNPDKGLTGRTGAPEEGHWRLVFESELALRVLGYVRTRAAEGFPNAVHDVVAESRPSAEDYRYEVVFFNPASNTRQASALRLVNHSEAEAAVTITGTDDAGEAGAEAVTLTLSAQAARRLSAPALESGEGEGLDGALGDGAGKWRLGVASDRPLGVMSLMRSPEGHLTNLSTAPPASR